MSKERVVCIQASVAFVIVVGLAVLAAFVIIELVKRNYPDYVSTWRQDPQNLNPSSPTDMGFFYNSSCTAKGIRTIFFVLVQCCLAAILHSIIFSKNSIDIVTTVAYSPN